MTEGHSYSSAKSNYTNLAFVQTHQKIQEEQGNLIEAPVSSARTGYNSPKSEQLFLPAGLIFLCSQRERKGQILAQPNSALVRPSRAVLWEAWLPNSLCLLLAAAPEAPLKAWLRTTEEDKCQTKTVPSPRLHPSMQLKNILDLYGY